MPTATFTAALDAIVALAQDRLPDTIHGRLADAAQLVAQGNVWPDEDGHTYQVASRSTPGLWYACNGDCLCADAQYQAPDGLCAHRLAVGLWRRTTERLAHEAHDEPALPVEAPAAVAPMCEVPAIMSTFVTIEGRQVEVKLCDTDDARLVARLTALLQQFPVPQGTPQPPREGWCHVHGTQMRRHLGKEGKLDWWSHKSPEGNWCHGE